jgi:hypothetical protein
MKTAPEAGFERLHSARLCQIWEHNFWYMQISHFQLLRITCIMTTGSSPRTDHNCKP